MNEQKNIELAQRSYELFKSGNIEELLESYSEDIHFQLPTIANVPFSGLHKGRKETAAFFQMVNEAQEALSFDPQEYVAQGDKVVISGNYSWRVRANGRTYRSDWVHIVTIHGGKITSFKEYMDTAVASNAYQKAASA